MRLIRSDVPDYVAAALLNVIDKMHDSKKHTGRSNPMKRLHRIMAIVLALGAVLALAGCDNAYNDPEKYVTLGKYKDWEVEYSMVEVTEDTITDYLFDELYEYVEIEQQHEGAIENRDAVNVDYTLYIGDEKYSDTVEDYNFYVGSGTFFDEVEDALVGASVGDTVRVDYVFPLNYSTALGGKTGTFEFKINYIIDVQYPELTDEFVAEHTEYSTYEEFFEAKKAEIEKENLADIIWNRVVSGCTVKKYPDSMKRQYVKDNIQMNKAYAKSQGVTYKEYLKQAFNSTEKEFEEFLLERSEASVGEELIVRAIAKREGITVSDEEYRYEIENNYAGYGFESPEEFEEYYGGNYIFIHIMLEKVLERIIETVRFF